MRAWGSALLPIVVAFFFLAGCSEPVLNTQTGETVTKTLMYNLPADLGAVADQVMVEIARGQVTYVNSAHRVTVVNLRVPAEYAGVLEEATLTWETADGVLQPRLQLPEGFDRQLVDLEIAIKYPAEQLPARIMVAVGTGDVVLTGVRGELDIAVEHGSCRLEQAILQGNSRVVAGGGVLADLADLRPGLHRLEAGFGLLEVSLPADAGVRVVARADFGEILSHLDFGYLELFDDTGVGARLTGWLNAGGSELELRVTSGNISLFPR
ncbi:MAG: hypothetical protein GX058_05465 [Firmicutes bacterium]|nr:hypothetical protein [Bacillota bacterium]